MKRKGIKFEIVTEKGVKRIKQSHVETAKLFTAPIEKDPDGNEFFTVYNPYGSYGKSRIKNFDIAYYRDRADLAFQAVLDGYADTIVGHNPMFGGLGAVPDLEPVIFLDHKVGELKRVPFEYEWKENLLGFSWAIKYYTGGWSDHILRDKNFNIVRFKTDEEASQFVNQVYEKVEEVNAAYLKIKKETGSVDKALEYYHDIKHTLYHDNTAFAELWNIGMLCKAHERETTSEESPEPFDLTVSCIPDFKKTE